MRKPNPTIGKWPPDGAVAARWANEGNFWLHARSVGRENPWDLIIFNFQTEDPWEVNWYLQNAVGCWRLDKSGNFKFDDALTDDGVDGKIYIPPAGWRPAVRFKKGSGAATFVMGIRHSAAAILRDLSVRMPTVSHGRTTMRAQDYRTVADLIETNVVSIDVDPDMAGGGGYSPENKAIELAFMPRIGDARAAATLANEAVHVISHYREIGHDRLKHEYVSTVAGAIAMGVTSERVLDQHVNPRTSANWGYYYAGWVWLNSFKPRGIWAINLSDLDHEFEHPYLSTTANPLRELESAMHAGYGGKKGIFDLPQWD